jgi:predicted nucleic acid-binding Zn ribbon protein
VSDFERLGDLLAETLQRVVSSDEAKAYIGWTHAAGDEVAAVTRPRRFARGVLTVECETSAWASDLDYLAPLIIEKLSAADPETPVKRIRFIVAARPLGPRQETPPPEEKNQD